MNIEIQFLAAVLKKNNIDPDKIREIIDDLSHDLSTEGDEKSPAVKKQYVILVSDPNGVMPADDLVGWVLQIPEDDSPVTTLERIYRAAYEFNCTKRGRMLPAKTVGDAIENVPAKHFKEAEAWIKTKTPVLILKTDNQIPKENIE